MLNAPIKSGGTVPRSAAEVMGSRFSWPRCPGKPGEHWAAHPLGNSTTDADLSQNRKAAERGLIESSGCDGNYRGQSQRFRHPNAIEILIVDDVVLLRCADGTGDPTAVGFKVVKGSIVASLASLSLPRPVRSNFSVTGQHLSLQSIHAYHADLAREMV